MAVDLDVRKVFPNPDYSEFTKECVKVGEQMQALGYKLINENYYQGAQTFNLQKADFHICVIIEEN